MLCERAFLVISGHKKARRYMLRARWICMGVVLLFHESLGIAGDHQFLVGGYDAHFDTR